MKQNRFFEEKSNRKQILELLVIFIFSVSVYLFSASFDLLEKIVKF